MVRSSGSAPYRRGEAGESHGVAHRAPVSAGGSASMAGVGRGGVSLSARSQPVGASEQSWRVLWAFLARSVMS